MLQVRPLTQFIFLCFLLLNIIDLPGGQFNHPSFERIPLLYLSATRSLTQTLIVHDSLILKSKEQRIEFSDQTCYAPVPIKPWCGIYGCPGHQRGRILDNHIRGLHDFPHTPSHTHSDGSSGVACLPCSSRKVRNLCISILRRKCPQTKLGELHHFLAQFFMIFLLV